MDRASFDRLVDETLEHFTAKLDALESEEFEVDLADGKLVIEFESGVKLIVSRQGAASQIWLAEPKGGWHYNLQGEHWICDKRGVELAESLEKLVSTYLGRPIRLK